MIAQGGDVAASGWVFYMLEVERDTRLITHYPSIVARPGLKRFSRTDQYFPAVWPLQLPPGP